MITSVGTCSTKAKPTSSPNIQRLLSSSRAPGDCHNPSTCPEWLDKDLFQKGRNFYNDYLFCIFFSNLLGLLSMFSISSITIPLMFTKKSDTHSKALKRYVSTVEHIIRWCENDVWNPEDESHRDIQGVRATHNRISKRVKDACDKVVEANYVSSGLSACPFSSLIRKDLQVFRREKSKLKADEPIVYFSQFDMVITQYAFMGFIVTHPRMMGLWWVSNEELEGFIHFWKGIGWLLGIDDKYNLCNGTVEDVKSMCLSIEQEIVMPHLSEASPQYEQLSRSLMGGLNKVIPALSLESMFLYLASAANVKIHALRESTSWTHYAHYLLMRSVFCCLFLLPFFIRIFNCLLRLALRVMKGPIPPYLYYFSLDFIRKKSK